MDDSTICGQCDYHRPAFGATCPAKCYQVDVMRRERKMPVVHEDDPACEHAKPRIEFQLPILREEFRPLPRDIGREVWGWRWKDRRKDTGIQAWMRKHRVE